MRPACRLRALLLVSMRLRTGRRWAGHRVRRVKARIKIEWPMGVSEWAVDTMRVRRPVPVLDYMRDDFFMNPGVIFASIDVDGCIWEWRAPGTE